MLTLFLLLSGTQHSSSSMQRRSDSSGVCSTRARVRLRGSTVAPLSLVSLQVRKSSASESSEGGRNSMPTNAGLPASDSRTKLKSISVSKCSIVISILVCVYEADLRL
jgi:hypothetical protein